MDNLEINLDDTKIKKTGAEKPEKVSKPAKAPTKVPSKKKKIFCIATFVVGLIVLAVGAVFLVLGLMKQSVVADGEYLVEAGSWRLDDDETACEADDTEEVCTPMVVWDFTEIGKGTLTTDGHEHDYDFIWALEDGKLLVETDWLYDLEDEFEYSLDQGAGVLVLKNDGGDEYRFVAQS